MIKKESRWRIDWWEGIQCSSHNHLDVEITSMFYFVVLSLNLTGKFSYLQAFPLPGQNTSSGYKPQR